MFRAEHLHAECSGSDGTPNGDDPRMRQISALPSQTAW
jgi:hypothetical protein